MLTLTAISKQVVASRAGQPALRQVSDESLLSAIAAGDRLRSRSERLLATTGVGRH